MDRKNDKNTHKFTKSEPAAMVVRVVAKCSKCGNTKTLYVDEKTKDAVQHMCDICENEYFIIIYR